MCFCPGDQPVDGVEREIEVRAEDVLHQPMRQNTHVDDVEKLFADGYEAVFLAAGSHIGRKLLIPGADHPDVLVALDFLGESLVQGLAVGDDGHREKVRSKK